MRLRVVLTETIRDQSTYLILNLKACVIPLFFMVVVILSRMSERTFDKHISKIQRLDNSNCKAYVRFIRSVCLNIKDYVTSIAGGKLKERYIHTVNYSPDAYIVFANAQYIIPNQLLFKMIILSVLNKGDYMLKKNSPKSSSIIPL